MLFQKYYEEEIDYKNGVIDYIKFYDEIYYDRKNVLKCPKCNMVIFYIENEIIHKCFENNIYEINEEMIKNKSNEFICKLNNIDNKCVIHEKELLYYKDSNYYCSLCLKEKNLIEYLNLEVISLSKDEINDFKKLIENSEKILEQIREENEKLIEKLIESYENFEKRNKSLIEYCKSLIKFNDKYEKNYNLISTIRRISIDINIEDFKNKINKDLIYFYNDKNIIKFNNEFKYKINDNYKSYFESDRIIKNGQYYLGELINQGSYGEVFKALSIKDKKLVAIKQIKIYDDNKIYLSEVNLLKVLSICEYSVKFIDSFIDNNYFYIVTELCDRNLRNVINNYKNGLSIQSIKKIFCQINEGLKYLKSKNFLHRDLKPDNILIKNIKYNNEIINYKYKLCDYGFTKDLNNLNHSLLSSQVGTPLYEAPEVKNNKYKDKSDLFSIGIILYELYYGSNQNLNQEIIINDIKNGLKIKNNNDDFNEFNDLKNLIEDCTKIEEKRIEWNEYFNHKFFNYEIELILEIKEKDLNSNIKLIGFDIFNNDNTELYIDNKKIVFNNYYKFNTIGNHFIKFIFNSNIINSSLEKMFYECKNIKYINFKIFNTSNVINMDNMFSHCYNLKKTDLSSFNTSNVNNMSNMFSDCYNLKEINLSSFNTSKVVDMFGIFFCCYNLKEINLSLFDTSKVNDMSWMFSFCFNLKKINLSSFNTSIVEKMSSMFSFCSNLKEINLSSFNTSKLKNMDSMFYSCYNLKQINLSHFDTFNVENMKKMFSRCYNLEDINLTKFITSKVKNMNDMFSYCFNLNEINLTTFNISNVENINFIFYKCNNLKKVKINEEFKNQFKNIINNRNILLEYY